MNPQQEINQLTDLLRRYNAAYRIGKPEVSDADYDRMVERLKTLDPNNEWLNNIEPAPVSANRKRRLPIPMKSLNKVKSAGELYTWAISIGLKDDDHVVVTPKFDGLSLLRDEYSGMVYSRGGAENEGQDCTEHYKAMRHYPEHGPRGAAFTFGEFVFSREYWEKYFAGRKSPETGDPYKSPRNTAAGMINRDKPVLETVFVDFFRYGVDENSLDEFDDYSDLYNSLCKHYDQPRLMRVATVASLKQESWLKNLFEAFAKEYYIDGLVIYVNDLDKWEELGRHEGTGNPRYAIAYKHPDFTDSFETTVKGIDWKVSKAGALKPVVNIEAVDTGDCTMENPTGYNALWIINNNIGPGAKILVTRSGGVIPKILSTLKGVTPATPYCCPSCGGKLERQNPELVCPNPNCPGTKLAKLVFFFKTVGVENIGEEMIAKLFNAGYTSIKSILDITERDITSIDGFGDGIAEIILGEMAKIKQGVPLTTLMHSSDCFKGIGKTKADKLMEDWSEKSLQQFISGTYKFSATFDDTITLKNFRSGYEPFIKFLHETQIPAILPTAGAAPTSDRYQGMNVCFSGIRDGELETAIVDGNGSIASGVSKKTTHLVVKDPNGTSSKISKAQQLGIPILTVEQFKSQF